MPPRRLSTTLVLGLVLAGCEQATQMVQPEPEPEPDQQSALSPTGVLNPNALTEPPTSVDGPLLASSLGQPVPASVIVVHNGLEWVWASPCALNGCTAGIDVGHDDFRFATVAEWALRPPASAFQFDKCASPWFDLRNDHCDWNDASQSTDDVFHNCCGLSTYGSAPAGVGGAAGGHGDPMHPAAETWLVRQLDNEPPSISFSLATTLLWPPNHTMHTVASGISATDNVDASPDVTITVTSNEADDGLGDGDTAGDGVVIDNGDGTYDVQVRAERAGNGSGRVYTITVTATDDAGNVAASSGEVVVPHSKGRN